MAKVTIDKRCEGPFHWETMNGVRIIAPLSSCGENLRLEYDDDDEMETQWAQVWESLGHRWACVPCCKSGNAMMHAAERARQKAIDDQFYGRGSSGKSGFKADKGKEFLF